MVKLKNIKVVTDDNFMLIVTFNNQEVKRYDMKNKLFGVFKILNAVNKFKEVLVGENGNVPWYKDKNVDSNIY